MLDFKRFRPQDVGSHPLPSPEYDRPISPDSVAAIFSGCGDFIRRDISAGGSGVSLCLVWLDGTVSGADVAEQVIRPLTDPVRFGRCRTAEDAEAQLRLGFAYGADARRVTDMDALVSAVAYGNCAAVLPGRAFVFQLKSDKHRAVQEPTIEKSVKGSKDALVESLRVNTALIRSRLRTPKLKLTQTAVGRKSRTDTAVMWIEGVSDPAIHEEILRRLERLDVDGALEPDVFDSGLADAPWSPFPQLMHSERPDKIAAALLDGRVAVLAEGMPVAFLAPVTLPEFMKTSEDCSQHFLAATYLRLLRWMAFALTLLLPAMYIAIAVFHAEMIPTQLLLSVIDSKQSVPFSTPAEILGMLIAFELLQEAGLRLPNPVGQTVSIIGALIVGQSAVEAKVISPITVIVVAVAGIAGYTMPSQDMGTALRICRFLLAVAAALAGMFGIVAGTALLLWHLCSLESFGRAYVATIFTGEGKEVFIRRPPWTDRLRDDSINGGDRRRRT